MANHLRCPLCGRNVRYSNVAKKVVRHRRWVFDRAVKETLDGVTFIKKYMHQGDVCVASGLKEGEVRNLRDTIKAFEDAPKSPWDFYADEMGL